MSYLLCAYPQRSGGCLWSGWGGCLWWHVHQTGRSIYCTAWKYARRYNWWSTLIAPVLFWSCKRDPALVPSLKLPFVICPSHHLHRKSVLHVLGMIINALWSFLSQLQALGWRGFHFFTSNSGSLSSDSVSVNALDLNGQLLRSSQNSGVVECTLLLDSRSSFWVIWNAMSESQLASMHEGYSRSK